ALPAGDGGDAARRARRRGPRPGRARLPRRRADGGDDPAAVPEDRDARGVIDSHTHLFLCEKPTVELLEAAAAAGVERMLNVGPDETTNAPVGSQAEQKEPVFASVGRHPNSAEDFDAKAQAELAGLAAHPMVRAIGETGLDFYR